MGLSSDAFYLVFIEMLFKQADEILHGVCIVNPKRKVSSLLLPIILINLPNLSEILAEVVNTNLHLERQLIFLGM